MIHIWYTEEFLYLVKGRQQEKVGHTQQHKKAQRKTRSRRRKLNWEIKLKIYIENELNFFFLLSKTSIIPPSLSSDRVSFSYQD